MGYFHVGSKSGSEDQINWNTLKKAPIVKQTEHVKLVRFEKPLIIKIDGQSSKGVILMQERLDSGNSLYETEETWNE